MKFSEPIAWRYSTSVDQDGTLDFKLKNFQVKMLQEAYSYKTMLG